LPGAYGLDGGKREQGEGSSTSHRPGRCTYNKYPKKKRRSRHSRKDPSIGIEGEEGTPAARCEDSPYRRPECEHGSRAHSAIDNLEKRVHRLRASPTRASPLPCQRTIRRVHRNQSKSKIGLKNHKSHKSQNRIEKKNKIKKKQKEKISRSSKKSSPNSPRCCHSSPSRPSPTNVSQSNRSTQTADCPPNRRRRRGRARPSANPTNP